MYIGYKKRNAKLDTLDYNPPSHIADATTPLANDDFSAITDPKIIDEVISYLFDKWNTLDRVIEARKWHHEHFYSMNYDYGHQAYIDKLVSHRHIASLALGRARKRYITLLYEKEQWYSWVRHAQDEEEADREKEQKKIRQEAALFKRHMKQLETRLAVVREKEQQKLQDTFLEDAYRERMAMKDDSDDEAWDPIEDLEDDKRNRYIDLIKHFLWMEVMGDAKEKPAAEASSSNPTKEPAQPEESMAHAKKAKVKKRNRGKGKANTDAKV